MNKQRYKDYIVTFITEAFVLIAGILVYKFANNLIGDTSFSEYALVKRTLSFIQPILMLGMGVGIPRYIAFALGKGKKKDSISYFFNGFMMVLFLGLVLALFLLLFPSAFSFLFFGNTSYFYLIYPLLLMCIGLLLHSSIYSYFRGNIMMFPANLLQIINLGIVPIISFAFSKDIVVVFYLNGIFWVFVSIMFFLKILIKNYTVLHFNFKIARELLIYGVQRMPGDIAIAGLFSLPAFYAAHYKGVKEAGYVAFGIILLNMVGAAFGPICLILLPESSKMISENRLADLLKTAHRLTLGTLIITLIGFVVYYIFAAQILTLYFGTVDPALIEISKIIMLGCFGYTLYISLRSILDAFYIKAVNTKNIFIVFIIFLITSFIILLFSDNFNFVLFSLAISLNILGLLTLLEINKIKKNNSI